MKLSYFLVLAGLASFSAASAQTAPTRGASTASPSAVPSGTAPMPANPKGNVSSGEVFTTGDSNGNRSGHTGKHSMKHKKGGMSTDGTGKTKDKM